MKVLNLERLLLEGYPLFQERHISLVVEKGSVHSPSEDDNHIYLVDLSDGVTWMLGFFMEGSSTMDSLQSRSLLAALQDHTITGLHILSARVCIYRCDDKLCPILYISHCRPIYHGHTTPMSKSLEDIQNRRSIKHWLSKLEQGTKENFLAKSFQDEFWDVYINHVEPSLDRLTTAFTTAGTPKDVSVGESQADTPIPSSSARPLIQPPPKPWPSASLGAHFSPTMTWETIQQLILDVFDNEGNDLYMDGFIPIPHGIWETAPTTKEEEENNDTFLAAKQQQSSTVAAVEKTQEAPKTAADDWCQLFLDVTNETTEYGRRKKLNDAKMEWMMTDTTLALE